MVKDGYLYALGMIAAAIVVAWLATPWLAIVPLLLAAFLLNFFRDPERSVPGEPGLVVSPADGQVTDVSTIAVDGQSRIRVSVFLNVFDVHVNRSPIAGLIKRVEYRKGKFANAMGATTSDSNEQNIVTVEGEGHTVIFKQIAGLIARRIIFNKSEGERLQRGERVGMIKFGSRTDLLLDMACQIQVRVGDKVKGGTSVIAKFPTAGRPYGAARETNAGAQS